MGGAIPGLVVLDSIGKEIEQATEKKPVSIPVLTSFDDDE